MSNDYFETCKDDTKPVADFLGSTIRVGDRGIRVDINRNYAPFKKFTVKSIDLTRSYNNIQILLDGSTRASRASGEQVIIQRSITVDL